MQTPAKSARLPLALLAVGYAAFIALDLLRPKQGEFANAIKYACLALCLIISMQNKTEAGRLSAAALMFSLAADWLLLFSRALPPGVVCFCCVQLLNIRRFRPGLSWAILGCATAGLAAVFALAGAGYIRLLEGVCAVYAPLLCLALALSRQRGRLCFGGMLLFLLCDICVALNHLSGGQLSRAAYLLIWLFYIPAQLLLALSTRQRNGRKLCVSRNN